MKKLLLFNLLLAMLLGATNAWADSGLYLFGSEVSSTSNWSYSTNNNLSGAITRGSVSYNASSKTVTFNNVDATVTGDKRLLYNKNVPGLKIAFTGSDTYLKSSYCVFRLDVDTEIIGSNSTGLVHLDAYGSNTECIYCPNKTNLTIRDFEKLKMTSERWRAFNTNGTTVSVYNSNIYAKGDDCAIQNNKGNDYVGEFSLSGCMMREPWDEYYGSVGEGYYSNTDGLNDFYHVHTSKAKSVMIFRKENYLGIRLKGIALLKNGAWSVNDDPTSPSYDIESYYTFDASTNTFTLKKDILGKTDYDKLKDKMPDWVGMHIEAPVTINGNGHSVYAQRGMACYEHVSLNNITIGGTEDGIAVLNCSIELKDDITIAGVESAIEFFKYGGQYARGQARFAPSSGKTVTLVPCNDKFQQTTSFKDGPINAQNSTTGYGASLQNCIITTPAGAEMTLAGPVLNGTPVKTKVVITGVEAYDLWVCETQVNAANASDILGDGGHFKYNASTKTLTVNNANLVNQSQSSYYGHGGIDNYGIDGLTVNFVGTSTFNTTNYSIYSNKNITLSGNGSLTATVTTYYNCIYLDNCTGTINGPQLDLTTSGIPIKDNRCTSTLNVTGSSTRLALHPGEDSTPIDLYALNIGNGLYITEPVNGYFRSNLHAITVDGTNTYKGDAIISSTRPEAPSYDLWIGETQVTSLNASDILGDGGHFKYNVSTKTLTVTNATIVNQNTSYGHGGIFNYGIDGLTVNFVGTSNFDTYGSSIYSRKDITLAGNGSLTGTVGSSNYSGILLYYCTCTINGPQLDFTAPEEPIYSATNSTLNVEGSSTRLALHPGEGYSAMYLPALNIGEGLYVTEPKDGYFSSNLHGITVDGAKAYKGDVIISNIQNRQLGLTINGTEMTTLNMNNVPGVMSGSAYIEVSETGVPTLVLDNATLNWNDAEEALNLHTDKDLTIKVLGDCVINAPGHTGLRISGRATIDGGGTLRINSKLSAIETFDDARLIIQGITTLIAHSSNYYGYKDCGTENGGYCFIESGSVFAAFGAGKYCPFLFSSGSARRLGFGVEVCYPVEGHLGARYVYYVEEETKVTNDWVVFGISGAQATQELIEKLMSEKTRELGFSINGKKMTALDMNNVPGVESGDAHIEEDISGAPVLVLDNATLDWNDADDALYLKSGTNLTIQVLGDCVINAPDHSGLNLSGNTTITGGGTLRINSKWTAISNWEDTRFTLQNNTTLIAYSSDSYGYYDEGYDYNQQKSWFIIKDGGLFAAFGKYGPISLSSDRMVNFDSATALRYPIGGQLGNNYVYDADGNEVTNDWVVIGPDTQTTQDLINGVDEIDSSQQTTDNGFIYNIAGQQMSNGKLPRGIYIQNGKKVLR